MTGPGLWPSAWPSSGSSRWVSVGGMHILDGAQSHHTQGVPGLPQCTGINEFLQFLNQVGQLVQLPLDGELQDVVQALTGIVGPSVAASCDVVPQKVYDAAFEVGSKAVWNEETGTQRVNATLKFRHVSTRHQPHQPHVTKDGIHELRS